MHTELRRVGVTLELLHLEYPRDHPEGYRYTAFGDVYRRKLARGGLVMRQHRKAGEKVFVNHSGKQRKVVDPMILPRFGGQFDDAAIASVRLFNSNSTGLT